MTDAVPEPYTLEDLRWMRASMTVADRISTRHLDVDDEERGYRMLHAAAVRLKLAADGDDGFSEWATRVPFEVIGLVLGATEEPPLDPTSGSGSPSPPSATSGG